MAAQRDSELVSFGWLELLLGRVETRAAVAKLGPGEE
jgi:hypothetical protein